MKVFFLLSDRLAEDIEEARKEIPEVKNGEAEICVIGENADSDWFVEKMLKDYPCVYGVYLTWSDGTYFYNAYGKCEEVTKPILEPGDRIFAHDARRDELEFIARILGHTKCDIRLTV